VNYTVVWMAAALQELAAICMASANRNAVTVASSAIDRVLASSPNTAGTVVFDTVREYTHPPLGVEFEVIEADRRVIVLSAWDAAHGRPAPTGN
jgi:hypothetical protein